MRKVLVLRGGALGDFIVTLPALALLRERWPNARIELAGNATAARLAQERGVVTTVHSQHEARWAGLFTDAPLSAEFADWLSQFDLVINYWPDPDGALGRHFPLLAAQVFVSASAMPARAPAAAHYCEPLRQFGIEPREYFYRLSPLAHARSYDDDSAGILNEERRFIAIHPGSGSPRKNWPAENWRQLIAQLPPPVSLILGEAEMNTFDIGTAAATAITSEPASDRAIVPKRVGERLPCLLQNRPLEEL